MRRFVYSVLLMAFIFFVFPWVLDAVFGTTVEPASNERNASVERPADAVLRATSDSVRLDSL